MRITGYYDHSKLGIARRILTAYLKYHDFGKLRQIRNSYLELMLNCLTGSIYEDPPLEALGNQQFDAQLREYGWDWPSKAHSMIGRKRMSNLRTLMERVIFGGIPGDFIETGVWRGGACIFMRSILKTYGITNRRIWLADSFSGLPPPDPETYPADTDDKFHTYSDLAVPIDEVKRNFEKYGLLDNQVMFLKGWFKDTLPEAPISRLAILRLDGDMYESTSDALSNLYQKLSPGGFVIVDDYRVVAGCRAAVDDFRSAHEITDPIMEIDGVGVYWQKTNH